MMRFFNNTKRLILNNVLNIIGLSVAFAAFVILIIQVNYELTFDRCYKDYDRIYRLESIHSDNPKYSPAICRPFGEIIPQTFPEVEVGAYTAFYNEVYFAPLQDVTKHIVYWLNWGSPSIPYVFGFELVDGNFDDLNKPDHIIIPQSLAEKFFPDESATGKQLLEGESKNLSIENNTKIYTIAAVYKDLPQNTSMKNYIYVNFGDEYIDDRTEWSFEYFYKLNKGVNHELLGKEIESFLLNTYYADQDHEGYEFIRLNPVRNIYFSRDTRDDGVKGNFSITLSLLTIAILIVVIAIINFINFSMATVPLNIRRINTMKVLGSTNSKLRLRQIFNIAIISIISYCVALLIVNIIAGTSFASLISAKLDFVSNWKVIVFGGIIAIVAGVLGGIYPAFYSTSFSPAIVLKGSFGLSVKGRKLRASLIAVQYIISITLLIVAMFIFVQNRFMKKHDLGFRKENVLTLYSSKNIVNQKEAFLSELKTNPNILDITFADGPIVSNSRMGWGVSYKDDNISFTCYPVATNFIDFFGIEVIEGRGFRESDDLKRNGTYIFNESTKEKYGVKVGDKIGGHLDGGADEGSADALADIVGIVKDFNFQPLQYSISPIALYVYGTEPWRLQTYTFIKITGNDTKGTIDHIRKTLKKIDPNITDRSIWFMDKNIEYMYQKEDNLAKLILISCFLSVFISIIGILGLIFYESQFRRKEIAIRRVFGSSISEILSMFNKTYLKITLICFVISVPISYFIIKEWLKSFAYRSPIPFWIWI
ncbi:ABC transporter permease, partial [Bacteroidales bacterium OttesenSCG-928-K03]|nr:ABC transporter permease [Bacteroidales bacterium OttesenSCG-928-K03]